jgi:hypothetical protein
MLPIRALGIVTVALVFAFANTSSTLAQGGPAPSPSPLPSILPAVVMPAHALTLMRLTITSTSPTPPTDGAPFVVGYHLTNNGATAHTGTIYGFFGRPFDATSTGKKVTVGAGSSVDGVLTMTAAPPAGSHTLTTSFYDPPLETTNVIPISVCGTPTSIRQEGLCLQAPLAQATETLAVAVPNISVRFGASAYAKISKPDSSDSFGLRSGYLFVEHNPGCTFGPLSHGNNGTDTFFATQPLPAFTLLTGVDFVQFWPIGKKPDSTIFGIGSYGATLQLDGTAPHYVVKWNNTCEGNLAGKPLIYAISFRVTTAQGTNFGETPVLVSAQPGLPEVPAGYSTTPDATKAPGGQSTLQLSAVYPGPIYSANFDIAGGGGTISAITNASDVQIGLLPPGATTCAPPYAVALSPHQTTAAGQLQQLYGAEPASYPRTIAACPVTASPGLTSITLVVTYQPS